MTALHSGARLRQSPPFRTDIRLAERNLPKQPTSRTSPLSRLQYISGVRSAHEPTGNLQDCPDHTVRHIYRHSITAGLQDTYQEPFPQAHLIENSILFRIASRHINRLTHTPSHGRFPCTSTKGSQQFPAVSSFMTAPLRSMPSASRHLLNIIRALIVRQPLTGCLTAGAPPADHTIRTMLSICLHLLWESESARRPLYLRTRVSTFPKEREECRQAATLYDGFQPVPAVSPAEPATFSHQEPSAEAPGSSPHHQHPTRNSLPYGCADSVRLRITGTTRETLTEPEQVRPGEESGTAHTHPRLHPASREQTLLLSRGVMSAPPSAPPPDIRQQSSSQPTHHASYNQSLLEACCRSPQRGQRYPDVRQPAPQSATHSGWSERGRCALTDASSPLPSSPASGPHRSSLGRRDSVRLRRPQTLSPKRKTAG